MSSKFFLPSRMSPSLRAIILSICPKLMMVFSSSFSFCPQSRLYLLASESFLFDKMVHIFTIPWYSLNCAYSRYSSYLSQSSQGIYRSGPDPPATDRLSCSATLLYLSKIFTYFIEKTLSYYQRRACSASDSGSEGFQRVEDSRLFIQFYSSFNFLSSALHQPILFSKSCFFALSLDYRPSVSYPLLSLSLVSSFYRMRMHCSLLFIASIVTLSWSACCCSCPPPPTREYFWVYSYRSSLTSSALSAARTFLLSY